MKTLYRSLLCAIVAAASLTACSDYDAPEVTTPSAITVLSHETTFPAAASQGSIKFEAKGPVTVTSASPWLTATVDGDVINLSAEQNNSLVGRETTISVRCGDATSEINVIQAGVIFKFAGVGTINTDSDAKSLTYTAEASVPVQIDSDSEWLSATIADGQLVIDIDRNKILSPRSGVLTITAGELSTSITVNQEALQCPLVKVTSISQNDAAKTYTYDFPTDITVDFTAPDWIKASFANETITIAVEENNEGHIREGELTWSVDGKSGKVAVTQYEFAKDIAGAYRFLYPRNGKLYYLNVNLTSEAIEFPTLGLAMPITYDNKSRTIAITPGGNCGTWTDDDGTATIFTLYGFIKDGKSMVTAAATAYIKADVQYMVEDNVGYTLAEFEDAGTYTYPVTTLILAGFMSEEFDFDYYEYNLFSFTSPYMLREHESATPETTPFKLSKRQSILNKASMMTPADASVITKAAPFAY